MQCFILYLDSETSAIMMPLEKRGAAPICEMPGYRTKYHQGVPYLIYFLEKQYKTVKNTTCMNYFIIVLRLNNDDPLELTLPLDSQPL